MVNIMRLLCICCSNCNSAAVAVSPIFIFIFVFVIRYFSAAQSYTSPANLLALSQLL